MRRNKRAHTATAMVNMSQQHRDERAIIVQRIVEDIASLCCNTRTLRALVRYANPGCGGLLCLFPPVSLAMAVWGPVWNPTDSTPASWLPSPTTHVPSSLVSARSWPWGRRPNKKLSAACIIDGTLSVRRAMPPSQQQEPLLCLGMMNW